MTDNDETIVTEKNFESLNDVKEYYQKNKDKLDQMTTVLLNKLNSFQNDRSTSIHKV